VVEGAIPAVGIATEVGAAAESAGLLEAAVASIEGATALATEAAATVAEVGAVVGEAAVVAVEGAAAATVALGAVVVGTVILGFPSEIGEENLPPRQAPGTGSGSMTLPPGTESGPITDPQNKQQVEAPPANSSQDAVQAAEKAKSRFPEEETKECKECDAQEDVGELKGRTKAEIEAELAKKGYSKAKGKGGDVWTKDLGNGTTHAVRLDDPVVRNPKKDWADEKPHAHKELVPTSQVTNGNYSPQAPGKVTLNDQGLPSTDKAATHIPILP
jgi:hypothetical protein